MVCNEDHLWIKPCYCVYFDPTLNGTVVGTCILTCYYVHDDIGRNFYEIDRYPVRNATQFNEHMCDPTYTHINSNREGRFCGSCKEGFGLAAYSYHYTACIPCSHYGPGQWLLYFTESFFLLTIFYIVVVTLKVNVASGGINGVVFMLQCILTSRQQRIMEGWVMANNISYVTAFYKAITAIFGVVNLDFFQTAYPTYCLHPKLNILHIMSLEYLTAFYPFFLIFMTYILVSMHDKNYRLVVWLWQPFKWCLLRCKNHLTLKSSLIETFGTFILFSYVKVASISFDLLAPAKTYDVTGKLSNRWYLMFDGNIEFFGTQHLPFALLALVALFIFVVFPFLLLFLYPFRWFQRCLNCGKVRSQALHIFMDAFQGSYKTEPHDLRHFSALFLLL